MMHHMRMRHLSRGLMSMLAGALLAVEGPATARGDTNLWQGTLSADWFEPGNWSLGTVPGDAGDVLIPRVATNAPHLTNATASLAAFVLQSNQTLTVWGWDSTIAAQELTVAGTIVHASNTVAATNSAGEWIPEHRIRLAGSNITLLATAKLDADYRGYPVGAGPGCGTGYGGSGHSGVGRRGWVGGGGGAAYGDPAAPEQPGSGGYAINALSRPGGGAVRISASGLLTVHGQVLARGQSAAGTHGVGGSGGSIWLACRTLAGSSNGLLAVDGGSGNYYGAGASAGRIAVVYDGAEQAALADVRPAIRFSGRPGTRGSATEMLPPAMATLYFPDTLPIAAPFERKRFQYTRFVIPGFTNWSVPSLTIDDCVIGLPDGLHLSVSSDLVLTNGAGLHLFAAPVSDAAADDGARVDVGGSLLVYTNSWVLPYAEATNGATVGFRVGGDLVVGAGGGFDADCKGYTFGRGPGSPPLPRGGGAYGGAGGQGYDGNAGGQSYGAPEGPVLAGSGGGTSPTLAGQGGGAIRIAVEGRAAIHGVLSASGSPGIGNHGPAGSGGGIGITCRTIEGSRSGLLRVDGGLGSFYGGSGSGGRIAVLYDEAAQAALPAPRPAVRFSAYAYPYSSSAYFYPFPAGIGTLCLPDAALLAESPSAPAVLDGQRFWHVRLVIPGFTNWTPASLTLSNCVLRFPDGFHLAVGGDLILRGGAGLQIQAAPTNEAAEVYGARLDVGGNLLIQSNAWVFPYAHPSNGAIVAVRVVGSAAIDAGGGIDADGKGRWPVPGNWNGPGAGKSPDSGGGYGGQGGGASGGTTNGSAVLPLDAGSPAGWRVRGDSTVSGVGGGAIHLLVGCGLTLDGTLTADGGAGGYYRGPGGSGGSIFVAAGSVAGTGMMRARGGLPELTSGSGGGGRVAVWYGTSLASAQARIAARSFGGLDPMPALPSFSGASMVDAGNGGVTGSPGTRVVFRQSVRGVRLMVR